jgi:hypothetical protein
VPDLVIVLDFGGVFENEDENEDEEEGEEEGVWI